MSMKQVWIVLSGLVAVSAVLVIWSMTRDSGPVDSHSTAQSTSLTTPTPVQPAHDATDHITEDPYAPNERIEHTAERVIAEMYSFSPAEDSSPRDAMVRGQRYMTGDLLDASERDVEEQRLSASWTGWAESGDYVTTATTATSTEMMSPTEGTVEVTGREPPALAEDRSCATKRPRRRAQAAAGRPFPGAQAGSCSARPRNLPDSPDGAPPHRLPGRANARSPR